MNLVCDATFYGKRKDKLGTLVFKDVESKEILIWKHIDSETIKDYKYLKEELIKLGYIIQSGLNSKNWCLKHLLKYGILVVNKGLFTNGCKKALKYA